MAVKVSAGGTTQVLPNAKEINSRIMGILRDPPPQLSSDVFWQKDGALQVDFLTSGLDRKVVFQYYDSSFGFGAADTLVQPPAFNTPVTGRTISMWCVSGSRYSGTMSYGRMMYIQVATADQGYPIFKWGPNTGGGPQLTEQPVATYGLVKK